MMEDLCFVNYIDSTNGLYLCSTLPLTVLSASNVVLQIIVFFHLQILLLYLISKVGLRFTKIICVNITSFLIVN